MKNHSCIFNKCSCLSPILQKMSLLLDLSSEILNNVLCNWLSFRSLLMLDRAHFSSITRSICHQSFFTKHVQYCDTYNLASSNTTDWIIRKGIKLKNVHLSTSSLETEKLAELMNHFGQDIRLISFSNETKLHIKLMSEDTKKYQCAIEANILRIIYENCPSLLSIHGSFTCATDSSLLALAQHCPSLKNVSFHLWSSITAAGVVACAKILPLTHLRLPSGRKCDHVLGQIFTNLKTVRSLRLHRSEIGDNDIALLQPFHLMSCELSFCANLTDSKMKAWLAKCTALTVVVFAHSTGIGDSSLAVLSANCPSLHKVDVAFCNVTDIGVLDLAHHLHHCLRTVDVSGCMEVTELSLRQLSKQCSSLRRITHSNLNTQMIFPDYVHVDVKELYSDSGTFVDQKANVSDVSYDSDSDNPWDPMHLF